MEKAKHLRAGASVLLFAIVYTVREALENSILK